MAKRVFLSYKRQTALDQLLAQRLHQALRQAGHQVFIDQGMEVGENWVRRIKSELETADCLVLLLSEHSVQSEMVAEEARIAVEQFKAKR